MDDSVSKLKVAENAKWNVPELKVIGCPLTAGIGVKKFSAPKVITVLVGLVLT